MGEKMSELQPGETWIEMNDNDGNAVVRTRSKAVYTRWYRVPGVKVIDKYTDEDGGILALSSDCVKIRADHRQAVKPTGRHKTSSKSSSTDGNAYKEKFYRSAFDPDK
jgi:hypothetical protein